MLCERYLSYLQCVVVARVPRMRLQETVTIGRHFGSYLWKCVAFAFAVASLSCRARARPRPVNTFWNVEFQNYACIGNTTYAITCVLANTLALNPKSLHPKPLNPKPLSPKPFIQAKGLSRAVLEPWLSPPSQRLGKCTFDFQSH